VPDAVWPTDNDWGVPVLDIHQQATALVAPVMTWGAKHSRKQRMVGTYHFYTDDYRFEALWDDPSGVVASGCTAIIEPNFTISPVMPRAVALWHTYRKRWLARYWQSFGIKVFVDMNVCDPHMDDVNLLGVPKGWMAWATHGVNGDLESTVREYEASCAHAGTDAITFVVYGGGKLAQERAMQRGWIYVPEQSQVVRGLA
jgi:hypothetical protein